MWVNKRQHSLLAFSFLKSGNCVIINREQAFERMKLLDTNERYNT